MKNHQQQGREDGLKRACNRDVARAAGVGPATVDRVLNNRGGVRPQTAARVVAAARQLGINRILPAPYTRTFRFNVILPQSNQPFYVRLSNAIRTAAAGMGLHAVVHLSLVDPDIAARGGGPIERALNGTFDGIILVGKDIGHVRAVVGEAARRGMALVTLVTDLPGSGRLAYVGIDNTQAGRTAGRILHWAAKSGDVLAVVGDHRFHGHAERLAGFRAVLEAPGSSLHLADIVVGHDDPDRTRAGVAASLGRHANIAGIYNAGGAVRAVTEAVRHAGVARPFQLAHELSQESRSLLQSGQLDIVIDQNPEMQGRRALEILASACGLIDANIDNRPIPFTIHCAENI